MGVSSVSDFTVGPILATFILGCTTLVLLLWYSRQKLSYWQKLNVPYAYPVPFLGSAYEMMIKPLQEIEIERYKRLGRVYGHYEGNRPLISIGDPELLRLIFVKDFQAFSGRRIIETGNEIEEKMMSIVRGEDWKRIRTLVTPTFTTGKMKKMLDIFKECSRTLVKNFREATEAGKPINAKSLYGAFTMDVIASSAFSTKIDSHNNPNNPFVTAAKDAFTTTWRFLIFTMMPSMMKLFKISLFSPEGLQFFKTVTLQIIEERKRTGQRRNDFLQLLLDTVNELSDEGKLDINERDDDIVENYGNVDSEIFKPNTLTKKTLSQSELVAQCVIFFLAGYETTASVLSFVSYCLALNPDVQDKLIQELDDVLKANNGELTYETIQSMKYLDNVIAETMRLYPPAIRTERLADEDYKLGDTGITIPKGMVVTIPIYAIHRDPEFFPDPEKFDPDRFTPEKRAKRDQYTYIPFGSGPRNCIGMRFALMEAKVCLVHVLSHFRIKTCPETKIPLDWNKYGQGLLMPKSINLKLEVRKDSVKDF